MTTPLAIRDLLDLHIVGQAAISPDGSRVAFVEAVYDTTADDTKWSIWTLPTTGDGAQPTRLTFGDRDSLPRWSPDGRTIAFLAAVEKSWRADLHVVDATGGTPRLVAALPRGISAFTWSPAGDGFAVTGGPNYPEHPYLAPAVSDDERRARYLNRTLHVDTLVYRGYSAFLDDEADQAWWCPLDGTPIMLTDGPAPAAFPGFAPDGRVTFVQCRDADHDRTPFSQVWAVARTGGEPEALTDRVNALRGYSIGEDGSLAYVGLPLTDYSFGSHDPRLFVDGKDVTESLDRPTSRASEVQSLTLDYLAATESPVQAPDGSLYFHVVDAGCAHVYRYLDGAVVPAVVGRRLVGDFSVGGDVLVFTATSPDEPVAIWVSNVDGSGERMLYDPNAWLADKAVGEIRHLPVTLADGYVMDAWAVLPAGYVEGTPLPAVLNIHPGPHSSFPWDYRVDDRLLANAGYAVLSCNQPGSQGYGEHYAQLLDGKWGDVDLPGYIATCDEAVRLGIADDSRLGVMGATYGGFAALWCVAHTDRFKACVTNRAITELSAMYGDADIGDSFLAASLGAEPWEDPELYRRLSPVTYIEQITAPVRLLAFNGNGRTTVAASEAVYRRLKRLGRESDMVIFPPGAATVLMPNRPWSKVRMAEATQEWFDQHLA